MRQKMVLIGMMCAMAASASAADPKGPTPQNTLQSAHRLINQKQPARAEAACAEVLAMPGATAAQKIEAYEMLVDIPRRAKDREKALAVAVKMGTDLADSPEALVRSAHLQADLQFDMGHKSEAARLYRTVAEKSDNAKVRQNANVRIAGIYVAENRTEDALAAYERIFTDSPTIPDAWFETQKSIVALLRKSGKNDEALAAARICLDVSPDANTIAQSCRLIAGILKDIDKNTTRANAFLAFQEFGPAGKDGAAGTADDLKNPLQNIAYPSYPQREKAFATGRQEMGDDAAASRLRALTFLYTGHPVDALQHLAEYFQRSHLEAYPTQALVNEVMALGVRPVRGHATDLKPFYEFIRFGPPGPDGQPNTADDLKDPFAEIGLKPRNPAEDGGLQPPPAAERAALIELKHALEAIAETEHDDHQTRMAILQSLERIHNALCDWGIDGQRDWYLGLVADALTNEYVLQNVLHDGEAAARGTEMHFAGVAAFWKQVDALLQTEGTKLPEQPQQLVARFQGTIDLLKQPPVLNPSIPPLK